MQINSRASQSQYCYIIAIALMSTQCQLTPSPHINVVPEASASPGAPAGPYGIHATYGSMHMQHFFHIWAYACCAPLITAEAFQDVLHAVHDIACDNAAVIKLLRAAERGPDLDKGVHHCEFIRDHHVCHCNGGKFLT